MPTRRADQRLNGRGIGGDALQVARFEQPVHHVANANARVSPTPTPSSASRAA